MTHPWDACSLCHGAGCAWCTPLPASPRVDLEDPRHQAAILNTAADLLYEPDDPRYQPRPSPAHVGQLRYWLRTLAEHATPTGEQGTPPPDGGTG